MRWLKSVQYEVGHPIAQDPASLVETATFLGFQMNKQVCVVNLVTELCVIGVRQRQNSVYIDELSLNK